ncbi:FAD binding domain-containing protein [Actinophytocola gossypii]|uniref:FAD binding domain-containing protein n=1 Tax=Actinophytocola gossypii TaxID=2812003 RepID=A0ABT2J143_9PSEU|nr:FAD binding domain-containing protein [Actinophytocola gossypii]MCT2581582.1 FAD binding domain-containing protein [Actinophytocola gossypii]
MSTAPTFIRPADLDGVTAALSDGDALIVGGGTMVVPELTHGRIRPSALVDLGRAGLAGVTTAAGTTVVGAMTTYTELEHSAVPLLATMAHGITGGPQIRHRGTVGGSASYANPSSDVPACLVALDARLLLAWAGGVREVAAADFFLGAFRTVREPDEVLAAITVPDVTTFGYVKFKLVEGSWPIVTAATVVRADSLRVVLGGAAPVPAAVTLDLPSAGTADPAWRDHVRTAVTEGIEIAGGPWDDVLAPGEYRARIAPVIAARSVARALDEESR